MLRKIGGKSAESKRYIRKRNEKRQAFKRKLEHEMQRLYEFESEMAFTRQTDDHDHVTIPHGFNHDDLDYDDDDDFYDVDSDGEYNYYTATDDDDDDDHEEYEYSWTRRALGAISPFILTSGVGMLLAREQSKKGRL